MSGRTHLRSIILSLSLALLLVMLSLATSACFSSAEDPSDTTADTVPAPDFAGTTLNGEAVSLSDYEGETLVLVFMASWCGPCREESPEIDQFYQDNKDRVALLAIAVDDSEESMAAFMTENGLTFPVMLDVDNAAGEYRVTAVPTTVVIDPQGNIVKRIIGGTTAAELSSIVDGITG